MFYPEDFPPAFDRDYHNDVMWIIDELDKAINELSHRFGDPFRIIADNIDQHVRTITDTAAGIFDREVRARRNPNDFIGPMVDAIFVEIASEYCKRDSRLGSQAVYDFLDDQYRRNSFLANSSNNPNRRDDYRRNENGRRDDRRDSNRYGGNARPTKQRQREYRQRDERDNSRYGNQQSSGNFQGRRLSDRKEAPPVNRDETQQQERKPTLRDGDVITSSNILDTGITIAPVYIIGEEQTVLRNNLLVNEAYTGREAVDYDKHRVDLLFPNIFGMSNDKTGSPNTSIAISAADKAMDNKIRSFVAGEVEGSYQSTPIFKETGSFKYDVLVEQSLPKLDVVEVRDQLIEQHAGNYEWFVKNSMIVNLNQYVDLGKDNDTAIATSALITATNYEDMVKRMISLSNVLDSARWRWFHDYITHKVNTILVLHAGINVHISSIIADWATLNEYVHTKVDKAKLTLFVMWFSAIFKDLKIEKKEENNYLTVKHTLVYLPLTSYECELASASFKSTGVASISADSALYRLVSRVFNDDIYGTLSFVMLDGVRFEVNPNDTTASPEYNIVLTP